MKLDLGGVVDRERVLVAVVDLDVDAVCPRDALQGVVDARSRSLSALASEKRRTVASKRAVSGMMLRRVPPSTRPTVITTGSKTSKRRVTIVCSEVIISAMAAIGSRPRCGVDPCPP